MVMIQGESLGQRAGTLPPHDAPLVLVDTEDDDALLARLRAGDETAFRALVDRHRPWLVRHCTRLLGSDAHAAEDAAQESLLKLHAAACRDARPLRVRAWLTVVARNTCIDEQRRRRPDLPGVLPERAAPGDDPFSLDAALAEAWPRLAGRHREVLYLREVLGFSYKEIGSVMGLSMPAVETLVFRARAALRREYEKAGGTAFGCGLFGFHLARMKFGQRRSLAVPDSASSTTAGDAGLNGLTSRLMQWVSTSLPGCGEQAMAKVLAVAAGVVVATATVLPGIGPFADAPASAAAAQPTAESRTAVDTTSGTSFAAKPASLKSLLGTAVPADWEPKGARSEAKPAATPAGSGASPAVPIDSLRNAAQAPEPPTVDRPAWQRPTLQRPVRGGAEEGRLRSILPERPRDVDGPEPPVHPLRLLLEAVPSLLDSLPIEPPSSDPAPVDPAPVEPAPVEPAPGEPTPVPSPTPEPGSHPVREAVQAARETSEPVRETLPSDGGNVADREPTLLQRRNG